MQYHQPPTTNRQLRIALQMDPIASINPRTDSTLLLGLEAQARGFELYYYTPDTLSWNEGRVTAQAHRIRLFPDPNHYYELDETLTLDLAEMNVILLRQDPPFDMPYITTTHLLEQLPASVLVINNPASVRNHPEKLFPILLRQFMPPTLISADPQAIEAFWRKHKDIILKPLYGHGGRAVLRVKENDENFHALLEMQFSMSREPVMAQKFLPEVKTQDRRIIFIDGKVAGIMGRIPAEDEIRANFRAGGSPAPAELTSKQQEICAALEPMLKEKSLLLAGIDVIGDVLTEINLTSPTGMVQMNRLYGKKLESQFWDAVEARKA